MIGALLKFGLILVAANSSRIERKRRCSSDRLRKRAEELRKEKSSLMGRIQSFPGCEEKLRGDTERAWEARVREIAEEATNLWEALQAQIGDLEGQVHALRSREAGQTSQRIRELEGFLHSLREKLARREATITEMEKEVEKEKEKEKEKETEKETTEEEE
ncbi:hypothetical protein FGB62_2g344 [Gracilaria domingensis]|nr:hypothetical protein FGB62_2g344 [Gracilaria domingensis]